MPTERLPTHRPRRGRLHPDADLELWLGLAGPNQVSAFASDEERRELWFRHRGRFIRQMPAAAGRRAWAWWQYEASIPWPGWERERSALWRAGALTEDEKVELEAAWRHHFDRSHAPGFTHCKGPGRLLSGARAQRAHYAWADIPHELIKQWSAERRRSAKTIRRLQAAAEVGVEG
jgi:hypothetical protein